MREIIKKLSEILQNREVVTCEEIERNAIRAALRAKSANALNIEYELVHEIKSSYTDFPISLDSLHYSEKVEIEDLKFYHLHTSKPTREQFEEAYNEFLISRGFLDSLHGLKLIADRFFKDYKVKEGIVKEYKRNRYRYAVFFSLIEDVAEDLSTHLEFASDYGEEYVIITPTEKTPGPFINFFKHYSDKIKAANIKIWVVDVNKESIDPFIGYPKDFNLLKGFKNPRLASVISSLWRKI